MKAIYRIYIIGLLMFSIPGASHAQKQISLTEALQLAKENNKSLRAQRLSEQIASERTREHKGALLPAVHGQGNYSYYFDRQVIFMPGTFTGNEEEPVVDVAVGGRNAFNAMITLYQPIVSEVTRNQVKLSKLDEAVHVQSTKERAAHLAMEVSIHYYTILLLNENIKLNYQSLGRNQRSLQDSRILLKQGKALKVDTLSNFIAVETVITNTSYLERQHEIALLQLKQLIGLSEGQSIVLTDTLQHDVSIHSFTTEDHVNERFIENRPDIYRQKLLTALNKIQKKQAQAQRLPVLSFVGAYQWQAQADNLELSSFNWPRTSYLGLNATVPIFSGNQVRSRIRQTSLSLEQSEIILLNETEKAKIEVASIEQSLKEAVRRLDSQEQTVAAGQQNFKIVNDRYRNGLSSRLELSDSEIVLSQAKLNYLRTVYDIKIIKLKLAKALGLLTL